MPSLSVLIPARNEIWLAKTIEDVLAHARGDTEVIAICDGAWPNPPVADHPKVTLVYHQAPIGQRAATNMAARLSTATYVMKLDAHCSVAEGFDVALMDAGERLGRDVTQIPAMYNLHAFNWKCGGCGLETYQGPTPTKCIACEGRGTPGGPFERVVYWDRRAGGVHGHERRTEFWRFDHTLHFEYWHGYKDRPAAKGDIADVLSSIGACFFMARDRFEELGGLDEAHGSWGQFGTEIACKSWLSGGRQVVNKTTWFAHLFRTQGGDFGFPYANPASVVARAREHSRKLWIDGTWPGAKYPLSWLIEKFAPVPDWNEQEVQHASHMTMTGPAASVAAGPLTKGLAYYTDNRGDPAILQAVRDQLQRAVPLLPVSSVALGDHAEWRGPPIHGSSSLAWPLERGYLTMFKQQLAALEALDTEIAFMVEHDVLYHPSHFAFTPPRDDTFYFNQHTWRVDAKTGQALFYLCSQVSGLCAYRATLVDHYRKRIAHVEEHGFDRNLGFEPGTNRRARALDGRGSGTWRSAQPNVDIKTDFCLTKGRWRQDQFRNANACLGWQLADAVPGWGVTKGRFAAFLEDVRAQRSPAHTKGDG